MIHESFKVYYGTSVNACNGVQEGLPVFGRFAARVDCDSIRLQQDDEDGHWWIGLPWGSTIVVGDLAEEETRELFERIKAAGRHDRWICDESAAREKAISEARDRHNSHAAQKPETYGKKFGGPVAV